MWEMVSGGDIPWHDKTNTQIVELVGHLKLKLHVSKATLQQYPQVESYLSMEACVQYTGARACMHDHTHARTRWDTVFGCNSSSLIGTQHRVATGHQQTISHGTKFSTLTNDI